METRRAWERLYRHHGELWRGERPLALPLPAEARVLELGCGNGKTLLPLAREGRLVIGLDFSRSALHKLRLAMQRDGLASRLSAGEATRLPFRDASFDAVLSHFVLPHVPGAARLASLVECRRVLRAGGLLSVEAFSRRDMRFGKGEEVEPHTFRRGSGVATHYFEAEELRALLESAGFASVEGTEREQRKVYGGAPLRRSVLAFTAQRRGT